MTKYSLSQECKPFSTFETISQWIYHINRIKDEDHRWSQKILRKNLIKSRQQNGCLRGLTNSCEKKRKVKMKSLSHVRLFATPWMVACQALWSMGFSRQEYWSEVPLPSPGKHYWALNQIPNDYRVEVRNRFQGVDLIDRRLMNYRQRFITLYRRQEARLSPRKRNAKKQNGCLRRPYK